MTFRFAGSLLPGTRGVYSERYGQSQAKPRSRSRLSFHSQLASGKCGDPEPAIQKALRDHLVRAGVLSRKIYLGLYSSCRPRQTGRRLSGGQTNTRERHVELPKEAHAQIGQGDSKPAFCTKRRGERGSTTATDSHDRRHRHHGVDH